jgi:peptidoglycan/xylan/chitin deacetylase (PgdA/CDA1 family)
MSRHPEGTSRPNAQMVVDALRHRRDSGLERLAGATRRLEIEPPCVALTFDDGPHPSYTPQLLDGLHSAGVLATFFWVGQRAQTHPELAKRVSVEGHCIGSHSFSHRAPHGRSLEDIRSDYDKGRAAVEESIGKPTTLFRPPYGSITSKSLVAVRQLALEPWLWSVDAGDWREGVSTGDLLRTLSGVGAGDVVLLHDGAADEGAGVGKDRSATVELIGPLVELLKARGLSFVTLDGRVRGFDD